MFICRDVPHMGGLAFGCGKIILIQFNTEKLTTINISTVKPRRSVIMIRDQKIIFSCLARLLYLVQVL